VLAAIIGIDPGAGACALQRTAALIVGAGAVPILREAQRGFFMTSLCAALQKILHARPKQTIR
jgi:hypothetical protein